MVLHTALLDSGALRSYAVKSVAGTPIDGEEPHQAQHNQEDSEHKRNRYYCCLQVPPGGARVKDRQKKSHLSDL